MRFLKRVLDFYINSSIHVALAVVCLTLITFSKFNILIDDNLLWFVFFATITGYNFVKYFGIAKFHHRRLASWLKAIQIFSFFCFLALGYFTFKLPQKTILYLSLFGIVTFFYAIPFLPKRFFIDTKQNLRSIGGLKVYVIAFVWTGVTVFLPFFNAGKAIIFDVYVEAIQRFILVIVLMLPFEIRDLRFDSVKLSTIPQQIGVKRTKILGIILSVSFFIVEFLKDFITEKLLFSLFLIMTLLIVLVVFSRRNQSIYYSAFLVESVPIIWYAILLAF